MKTFLLFVGKSCPACATMKANMAKAGIQHDEIDRDTTAGARLSVKYFVTSIPVLAVFIDGKLDSTHIGALPVSELEKIKGMAK